MKTLRSPFAVALAAALLLTAVMASGALASPDPFRGAWESIDIDGSYQTMAVGGGPGSSYRITYRDFGATVCGLDPDTGDFLAAASARGFLSATGPVLSGDLEVLCRFSPPVSWGVYTFSFTYDVSTDTLADSIGVVWSRR